MYSGQIHGAIERTGTNPRDIFKTTGMHDKSNTSQIKRQCVPNQPIQINTKEESVTQKGRQQICRRNHTKNRRSAGLNLMLKIRLLFHNSAYCVVTTISEKFWYRKSIRQFPLLSHMPFQKNFPALGTTTRLRIPEKSLLTLNQFLSI